MYMHIIKYTYMNAHIFRHETIWVPSVTTGKERREKWKALNMEECAQSFNTYLYENILM